MNMPDPSSLTDEQIYDVAQRIAALGQRVAGTPGEPVTTERRAALDAPSIYLFDLLHVGVLGLIGENQKRCDEEAAAGLAQLEAFLREVEL